MQRVRLSTLLSTIPRAMTSRCSDIASNMRHLFRIKNLKLKMKGEELSINEQLKEIKRSFRLMMNGVAAQSMRDKGLDYHVNWGASVPMLKAKAK